MSTKDFKSIFMDLLNTKINLEFVLDASTLIPKGYIQYAKHMF